MWADLPAVETFPQLETFPASWNEKDQKVDPGILSREDWDNNPLTKIQPTGLLSSQTFTDRC